MTDMLEDVGSVCGDDMHPNTNAHFETFATGRTAGPDMNTIQGKYSSAGKNTLYYLVPDTCNLYLLDFKQRKFIKKNMHLFSQFSISVVMSDHLNEIKDVQSR